MENQTIEKPVEVKETVTDTQLIEYMSKMFSKQADKKETKSIEYKYVFRESEPGKLFNWDFAKEGSILFKWTGEYWKEQTEEILKGEIAQWLRANHPTKFTSKSLSSIYSMLVASVKCFNVEKSKETIIPTKTHWLLVDDVTGEITAIKPNKTRDIRYQIDMVVSKAGPFFLPTKTKPFPAKKEKYFHKFIESSLAQKEKRELVQEYCGYTLTNSVRKQVMQQWIGAGANGKSVLIELLAGVHGNPVSVNIATVHEYNNHLTSASLIYCTETSKKFDVEFVKQAVVGDRVELRGIYAKKQNAYLTAKWIMLMNQAPHISDFSDGLFRRIQLITWDAQFDGKNGNPEPIDDLALKILNNEKEDFLIWCLQGLQRLIKADWKFTKSTAVEQALDDLRNNADKVRLFLSEQNYKYDDTIEKTKYTSKNKVFKYFNEWADKNNFEQMSSTTFWLRVANVFPKVKTDPEKKIGGERVAFIRAEPETTGV